MTIPIVDDEKTMSQSHYHYLMKSWGPIFQAIEELPIMCSFTHQLSWPELLKRRCLKKRDNERYDLTCRCPGGRCAHPCYELHEFPRIVSIRKDGATVTKCCTLLLMEKEPPSDCAEHSAAVIERTTICLGSGQHQTWHRDGRIIGENLSFEIAILCAHQQMLLAANCADGEQRFSKTSVEFDPSDGLDCPIDLD